MCRRRERPSLGGLQRGTFVRMAAGSQVIVVAVHLAWVRGLADRFPQPESLSSSRT